MAGSRAKRRRTAPGISKSSLGVTKIGVRWKTVRWAARFASSGTSWTDVAPVPMTATRLPSRSAESSHFAVCTTVPANSSTPSMSGTRGCERKPVAVMRYDARTGSPSATETSHTWSASSHRAPSTTVSKRMCRRRSYLAATWAAYFFSSGPRAYQCRHHGLGSKE